MDVLSPGQPPASGSGTLDDPDHGVPLSGSSSPHVAIMRILGLFY